MVPKIFFPFVQNDIRGLDAQRTKRMQIQIGIQIIGIGLTVTTARSPSHYKLLQPRGLHAVAALFKT